MLGLRCGRLWLIVIFLLPWAYSSKRNSPENKMEIQAELSILPWRRELLSGGGMCPVHGLWRAELAARNPKGCRHRTCDRAPLHSVSALERSVALANVASTSPEDAVSCCLPPGARRELGNNGLPGKCCWESVPDGCCIACGAGSRNQKYDDAPLRLASRCSLLTWRPSD